MGVVLRIVAALAAGWALIALFAWVFQRRMIYHPLTGDLPSVEDLLPGGQDALLRTADGLDLGGWFVPAAGATPRAVVIVFNGNAGNRSFRAPLALELSRVRFSVLLFDYRGYGDNPGQPSEPGLLEDARAARRWLEGREDVDPDRILYFGESLGCAVALSLAAERPPAAIVLRSPFTSLVEVGRHHYPFLPAGVLLRDRFDGSDLIAGLACPLLVIAGERDRIVPPFMSAKLWQSAPQPKRFVVVPGADHNDEALVAGERVVAEMVRLVEQVLP